jgi:catechol 2,3-dioxygenase-like lactoylglutathione lyase family enzyme
MTDTPRMTLWDIVLDAPDARELADFYRRLLRCEVLKEEDDWVMLAVTTGNGKLGLGFQTAADYQRPAWPNEPAAQQMMQHLDIGVDDLDASGEFARDCGATLAEFQPQDNVRVWLDPAGHPFCLFLDTE